MGTRPPKERPNIILINCDDLGYGDLGCYGSDINKTPYLDSMCSEGTKFTDFYMASPVCSPSRGAMMTGCYPPRIGFGSFDGEWVLFPGQGCGLSDSETTIASVLKDRGYSTKIVGKWHCGDQPEFLPTRHGFDSYYGLPYSNDMGRQGGRESYPPLPLLRDETVIQEQPDQTSITERYVEECVGFIRQNQNDPFFLYFAEMYVHLPIYAPWRFLKSSQNGPYGAAVECIDWSVGVIMDELRSLGLEENTLILFSSDNGSRARSEGGSNKPLRGTKGTTWEGGQRLPLIARWPGAIPAGRTCRELVASLDLYPTLAGFAGAEVSTDREIDGLDIGELILGEKESSPRSDFYYYHKNDLEAVRVDKWKLHFAKQAGPSPIDELYNLESDIGESKNLYDERPDVVERLQNAAATMRERLGDDRLGIEGKECRPVGRVDNPKPLTTFDPDHPYMMAMYDLPNGG